MALHNAHVLTVSRPNHLLHNIDERILLTLRLRQLPLEVLPHG